MGALRLHLTVFWWTKLEECINSAKDYRNDGILEWWIGNKLQKTSSALQN